MPFEDAEHFTRDNLPPTATISYTVTHREGKAPDPDRKPRLTIAIPTTICGTSKSERFKLQIGSGKEAGKIRIAGVANKSDKSGVEPSQHAHFFKWNFGYVPRLGDDKFDGEKHPVVKISDEVFEITVPESWFMPAAKHD